MSGSSPTAASATPASVKRSRPTASHPPAVAVAVSGGPDSMALLWVVWKTASDQGLRTWALHVHHGLQPAADEWPVHIGEECRRWSVQYPDRPPINLRIHRVGGRPPRGHSVEDWARDARYAALVKMAQNAGVDLLLLGHHRGDQAETFLLQALRGAGPKGLAAMPRLQWREGVCLARPWLDQPRQAVRTLSESAGIESVEDPSNQETRYARNRVRKTVWPVLIEAFEQAEAALALAAQRCAHALDTLEQGAHSDLLHCCRVLPGPTPRVQVDQPAWAALSQARRSWVLRTWLAGAQAAVPAAVVDHVAAFDGSTSTVMRWSIDSARELRWYRGVLTLSAASSDASRPEAASIKATAHGPAMVLRLGRSGTRHVQPWGGTLVLQRAASNEHGLNVSLPLVVHLRPRLGDDQFQLTPRGTARSLKKQFQARGVPAWERDGPVVTSEDGTVLLVPGLGLDARVATPGGRWVLQWQPDSAAGQD